MKLWLSKYWAIFIPLIVILILAIYLFASRKNHQDEQHLIIGLVDAESVDVSSAMPGRLRTMNVHVGDTVREGQVIAELDLSEIGLVNEQAKDAIKLAQNNIDMLNNGTSPEVIAAAKNLEKIATDQVEMLEKTNQRFQNLYEQEVVSGQEKELVEFRYKASLKELENAKLNVQLLEKGARQELIDNAELVKRQMENAEKIVSSVQENIEIKAAESGIVTTVISHRGEMINAGYPLITIQKHHSFFLTFNIRQDLMSEMEIGKELEIKLPGAKPEKFLAKVIALAPALGYADWIPESASGQFQLKTFNVKLTPVDPQNIQGLRSGMSAQLLLPH